jgi:hypothetical protein
MRVALFAVIALDGAAFAAAAFAAEPAVDATDAPVLAFTPSGVGTPDAIVCRAPQKLEKNQGYGPRICLRNRIWIRLTRTAQDLAADGKSVFKRSLFEQPHGEGPAQAVTCRKPATIAASRVWHGPVVCLENRSWAALYARGQTVTGDGRVVSTRMSGPASDATGMPLIQAGPPPRGAPAIGGYYSPL